MKSHEENKMKSRIILAGVAAFANPALAANHQVKSLADAGPDTLRAAIAAAVAGDTITFAPWLHKKTILLENQLVVDKEVTIDGDIDGDRKPDIRLDGHGVTRMINVHSDGKLTLKSLILEDGSARDGGAIYNTGWLQINYSLLTKNNATFGGAIFSQKDLFIKNSTLTENTASDSGGAIHSKPTGPGDIGPAVNTTVYKSTLSYNWAKSKGGAIKNHGNLTIKTSTFSHNRARSSETGSNEYNRGGAIWTYANRYSQSNKTEIYDSTFVGNQSHDVTTQERTDGLGPERLAVRTLNGGTIYIENAIQHPIETHAYIKIQRTVIANSIGRNCGGAAAIVAENLWSDDNTCGGLGVSTRAGVNRGDPKLLSLDNNGGYTMTHLPMAGSGLIDAGGSTCANSDQRGARRTEFMDPKCDIGAVETNAHPPSRPRPQSINTTTPAEYNEDPGVLKSKIAEHESTIAEKQAEIEAKAATIAEKQDELDEKTSSLAEKQSEIESKAAQIATLNEQLTSLNAQLASLNAQLEAATDNAEETARLQALIAEKEALIAQYQARIDELENPDDLSVEIGDAGKITTLELNGVDILGASSTRVKIGSATKLMGSTTVNHARKLADGSTQSSGAFQGDNGLIYWLAKSTQVPGTDFYFTHWIFNSEQSFGDVSIWFYADVDIGEVPSDNALIVGGDGHPNRLLVTDSTDPTQGVALGLRTLRNTSRLGWFGDPTAYNAQSGNVLDASILTGTDADWQTFTPDASIYPGAQGYGPADIALMLAVKLKPSAKLASFETTLVGAPNGYIE